ncbi:hypothetical protein GDO86_013858 [Hymenochirus boettgeri]|uniref:Bactericidal permeability-increasing protein n=1 Tax=Hymenochirus boettgeri TaxID=247094 RepID=A0A8T2JRS1_9PIPI|nr:hypothetical protein GDO86_013858 [Hymenochirus boettgeri]
MVRADTLYLVLSVAVCVEAAAEAVKPGAIVRLTQKGLDYARQEGISVLQQQLSQIHLPDFSGSYDVGFLGNVDYRFSGLVISSVQLADSQVSLIPSVGLKLTISGAFIQIDGNWDVRYTFIHEDGSLNLKLMGVSISAGLILGSDTSGRPTISPADCSSHISNVEVHMSGTIGWLVDLFHGTVESALRQTMESQICPAVTESINTKLDPLLKTLPVIANIDHTSAIDYSLTGPPSVLTGWVDVQLKGEFFDVSHRTAPPFSAPEMPLPPEQGLMVYFGVSEYLFNTAAYVYQLAGALVFNLTDDMIPKDSIIRLNTSFLGTLIPQVLKMYPDMLVKLKMSSPSVQALKIKPDNLTMWPVVDVQAFAILPNSSLASLFLIQLTTNATAKVALDSGRIIGNLDLGRVETKLVHSDVGPFSVSLLNEIANYCVSRILLPRLNVILKKGLPLPLIDHVEITDSVLQTYEHYLLFGANVRYV